jgi:hypothetical protein
VSPKTKNIRQPAYFEVARNGPFSVLLNSSFTLLNAKLNEDYKMHIFKKADISA